VHVEAEKQILLEEIAVKDAEANQRRQAKHDSANAAGAAAETVEAEIAAPRHVKVPAAAALQPEEVAADHAPSEESKLLAERIDSSSFFETASSAQFSKVSLCIAI
jgi:hypothetical protein